MTAMVSIVSNAPISISILPISGMPYLPYLGFNGREEGN